MTQKRAILVSVAAIITLAMPFAAVAADWPMYLYNPAHSSFTVAETQIGPANVASLQPAWSYQAAPLGGAPTVVGGVIYIGDWSGDFHAIRESDGSLIWKQYAGFAAPPSDPLCDPPIGVTGQAVVQNGTVYVPGGDSAVYAFDQNSGAQLARVQLADSAVGSYLWSSLTLVNNSLYLGIASLEDCPLVRGALVRIDLANPKNPLIKYVLPADDVGAGIWSTPAVDAQTNTVYATTGNGTQEPSTGSFGSAFISFDAQTLDVKNYFFLAVADYTNAGDNDIDFGSSPTLFVADDGTPLVAATGKDGVLYVLRRSDMTLAWRANLAVGCDNPQSGCGSLSTPAWDGSTLYVGAGVPDQDSFDFGSVYAFRANGERVWFRSLASTVLAPVTVVNGLVFVSTLSGLMALDASTGESLWDDGGAGTLYSQPVVANGTVYAAYANGTLTAYRLGDGGEAGPPARTPPPNPHR
jgi:outer membrane protein assembly factor BamB